MSISRALALVLALQVYSPAVAAQTAASEPSLATSLPAGSYRPAVSQEADRDVEVTAVQDGPSAPQLSKFERLQKDNIIGKQLRALKTKGIDLSLDFVGNIAGNPIGGNRNGFAESHWVSAAANVDLEKALGWSDTKLHVQGAWFSGESLGRSYIGNSISFQQTWRPVPGPRLTQFNIERDFGRLNVVVGRAAVNSYFNNSPLNCLFMTNTSCLTAYGGISDIGITAFPNSSWAAKVQYSFSKEAYFQIGVFDYNNDLNLKGKAGLDFALGKGSGTLIAGEFGYESDAKKSRFPGLYKVGFYLNTDGGQSPYYDANHGSAAQTGLPRTGLDGNRVGIYGLLDQTVLRASGSSKRNLALFARAFLNVGNTQQLDWFASAGFVKTGTFRYRDADTIGFIVSNTHFSGQQIAYLRDLRAKAGGKGSPKSNEIIAELNYGFAALPGLRIMPNIQYAINPDPIYATSRKTDIPNALVLGVRLDLKLAQFFGK